MPEGQDKNLAVCNAVIHVIPDAREVQAPEIRVARGARPSAEARTLGEESLGLLEFVSDRSGGGWSAFGPLSRCSLDLCRRAREIRGSRVCRLTWARQGKKRGAVPGSHNAGYLQHSWPRLSESRSALQRFLQHAAQ